MSKKLSYLKCKILSHLTTGQAQKHYQQKKKRLKNQILFYKSQFLINALNQSNSLQRILDYLAYQKFFLIFKQHYNITIPAEVCGAGNHFNLVRIKVGCIRRQWIDRIHFLKECSPYKFLETRNEKIYQKYVQKHIDLGLIPENTAWDVQQFIDLEKSVLKNGYNPEKSVIVIDQNNIILDGQHRSCILLYTYGEDYEIPVVQVSRR